MKNNLIVVIIIIVLVSFAWWFMGKSKTSNVLLPPQAESGGLGAQVYDQANPVNAGANIPDINPYSAYKNPFQK